MKRIAINNLLSITKNQQSSRTSAAASSLLQCIAASTSSAQQQQQYAKLRYNPDQVIIKNPLKPSIAKLAGQYLPKEFASPNPQQMDEITDYKGFKIPKHYVGDLSNLDFTFLSIYTKYKVDSVNDSISVLKEIVNGSQSGQIKKEEFATICLKLLELISMNICELENLVKQHHLRFNKIVSLLNLQMLPELIGKIKERINSGDLKQTTASDARKVIFLLENCDWFQFGKKSWFWANLEKAEEEFRNEVLHFNAENMQPITIPKNYIGTLISASELEILEQAHVLHERHGNYYFDASKGLLDENEDVRRISYSIQMFNMSSGIEKKVESLLSAQKALAEECGFDNFYELINRNDVSDFREVLNASLLELQQQMDNSGLPVSDLPFLRKNFLDDPIRKLSTKEVIDGLQNIFLDLFKIDMKFTEIRPLLYDIDIKTRDGFVISSGKLDLGTSHLSKTFLEDCRYFAVQYATESEILKFFIKENFSNNHDSMTIENVVDLFIQLTKAIRHHIDDDSFSEIEFNREEMFVIDRILELTIRNEKVFLKYFYTEPSDIERDSVKKLYHERSQRLIIIQNIEDQAKIMSQLNAYSYYTEKDFKETEATRTCRQVIFKNIKEQLYRIPDFTITGRRDHLLNQHFLKKQAREIWNLYFAQNPLDSSKMLELFCSTPEIRDEPKSPSKLRSFFTYMLLFVIFSIVGYIYG